MRSLSELLQLFFLLFNILLEFTSPIAWSAFSRQRVQLTAGLTELLLGEKIIADAGNLSGIAAAVNEKIVSKKDWNHYEIKEGDSGD